VPLAGRILVGGGGFIHRCLHVVHPHRQFRDLIDPLSPKALQPVSHP
jgi:hypothetical protein